jgi:putative protease
MDFPAGKILNYYSAIRVASVEISDYLEVGSKIHIKGHTTDFEQIIESMQIKHAPVTKASKGDIAGIKVADYVRKHDIVYRLED